MEERFIAIIRLAHEHGPCSVRHLFYRAVVEAIPGITKDLAGYLKVQRAVLDLRRVGRIPYRLIVDSTRWVRAPETWNGLQGFLTEVAGTYRRDMWGSSSYRVEVWAESESIAGTIAEMTTQWGVPLFVTRGQSSETFAWNAAQAWRETPEQQNIVIYIGDHDPAGLEIEKTLRSKLVEFSGVEPSWARVGVTWNQVLEFGLPGGKPKKAYGFPLAVEAEALPPRLLVELLDHEIDQYADPASLAVLRIAEESERNLLSMFAERVAS